MYCKQRELESGPMSHEGFHRPGFGTAKDWALYRLGVPFRIALASRRSELWKIADECLVRGGKRFASDAELAAERNQKATDDRQAFERLLSDDQSAEDKLKSLAELHRNLLNRQDGHIEAHEAVLGVANEGLGCKRHIEELLSELEIRKSADSRNDGVGMYPGFLQNHMVTSGSLEWCEVYERFPYLFADFFDLHELDSPSNYSMVGFREFYLQQIQSNEDVDERKVSEYVGRYKSFVDGGGVGASPADAVDESELVGGNVVVKKRKSS